MTRGPPPRPLRNGLTLDAVRQLSHPNSSYDWRTTKHVRPLPSHRRPRRWYGTWSGTWIPRYSNLPRRVHSMHRNRSPRDVMPPSRHQSPQAREWPLGNGVQVTSADRRKAHPPGDLPPQGQKGTPLPTRSGFPRHSPSVVPR
jgi:hypothetical protein